MKTDKRMLRKAAKACVALEMGFAPVTERDRAAMSLAYSLCRIVVLGMNHVDQADMGSCRLRKDSMTLTKAEILSRLASEYDAVMREIKASDWKPDKE